MNLHVVEEVLDIHQNLYERHLFFLKLLNLKVYPPFRGRLNLLSGVYFILKCSCKCYCKIESVIYVESLSLVKENERKMIKIHFYQKSTNLWHSKTSKREFFTKKAHSAKNMRLFNTELSENATTCCLRNNMLSP